MVVPWLAGWAGITGKFKGGEAVREDFVAFSVFQGYCV